MYHMTIFVECRKINSNYFCRNVVHHYVNFLFINYPFPTTVNVNER